MAETDDDLDATPIKAEPDAQFYPEVVMVKSAGDDELPAEQPEEVRDPAWAAMETDEDYVVPEHMPEKDFILKLESIRELWDPSYPHYNNKYRRYQNLSKLLPFLRKVKPNATIADVKRKINTVRSNFRRELRKMSLSQQSGTDVHYRPKLWYFPYVQFLLKLEKNGKILDNITDQEKLSTETATAEESTIDIDTLVKAPSIEVPTPYSSSSTLSIRRDSSKKKKKNHTISEPERQKSKQTKSEQNYSSINNPIALENNPIELKHKPIVLTNNLCSSQPTCNSRSNPIALENNPIALEWASTLDRLDPIQRLHAKKAINDILYEAELGTLNRYSVRINETGTGASVSGTSNNTPIYIINPLNAPTAQHSSVGNTLVLPNDNSGDEKCMNRDETHNNYENLHLN